MAQRPIGGFFPLALPAGVGSGDGAAVLDAWLAGGRAHLTFRNARCALHHVLRTVRPRRMFVPAYVCDAVVAAAAGLDVEVVFGPTTAALDLAAPFVRERAHAGDVVVAVDVFGRRPGDELLRVVAERRDIVWVEDRAQALAPGAPWGDFVLYSPRKLLGVPDGGLVVQHGDRALGGGGARARRLAAAPIAAALLRFEDDDEAHNDTWYPAYQAQEAAMPANDDAPMMRTSEFILAHTALAPLVEKRRANFAFLHARFPSLSFLAREVADVAAPLGFVVRHVRAGALFAALVGARIFAQRHWQPIAAPADQFPAEHALAGELVTLPCDHRYGTAEMERVAAVVAAFLTP